MKRVAIILMGSFFVLATASFCVAADSPMAQLQETIDNVLVVLETDGDDKPAQIANAIQLRFDFEKMAQLTLRSYWEQQTADQRQKFIELFSKMLEKTYIARISLYSAPKVEFIREMQRGNKAEVATKIIVSSGNPIQVSYRLHQCGKDWKIYDVNVEGVSLVRNYRNQFASILKNNTFATLLSRIEKKVS